VCVCVCVCVCDQRNALAPSFGVLENIVRHGNLLERESTGSSRVRRRARRCLGLNNVGVVQLGQPNVPVDRQVATRRNKGWDDGKRRMRRGEGMVCVCVGGGGGGGVGGGVGVVKPS
jgi:hypothetical protein